MSVLKLFPLAIVLLLMACAHETRYVDHGLDYNYVIESYNAHFAGQSSFGGGMSTDALLEDNQNTTLYFAESNNQFGSAQAVLSFYDFSFIQPGLTWDQVAFTQVFFFDQNYDDGSGAITRNNALLIYIETTNGSPIRAVFTSGGTASRIDGDVFTAVLNGNQQQIVVKSKNLMEGLTSLDANIGLELYFVDPQDGQEYLLGDIPVLAGFGGN